MRLRPRQVKRRMFTCTQCQQCVQACDRVNQPERQPGLLCMVSGPCAEEAPGRSAKHPVRLPEDCFGKTD
jgi:dissimilatory sulfite reductase (desulfoviridin) alpha/beta subunit